MRGIHFVLANEIQTCQEAAAEKSVGKTSGLAGFDLCVARATCQLACVGCGKKKFLKIEGCVGFFLCPCPPGAK